MLYGEKVPSLLEKYETRTELKEEWKALGGELGRTALDLGKLLVRTAEVGADKLQAWLEKEEEKQPIILAGVTVLGYFQALAMYHSQEQSSTALMGDNTTENIHPCL